MKSLKRILSEERTFYVALGLMFFIRITYALTRDIFSSGPDAPNYAFAPLDLVKYGFWSKHITGGAFYPQGYPVALWPAAEIGGSHWVTYASVWQIALSVLTIFLVYKIALLFLTRGMALTVGFVFLLSPAYIPMSGAAMYEAVLMFCFFLYLYLILNVHAGSYRYSGLIAAGLVGGFTCVVHPRALPWVFIIQVILFGKIGIQRSAIFFGFFLLPVGLFLIRNKVAENKWTLSSAASYYTWPSEIKAGHFGKIMKDGLWNAIFFWSPYSGDARRGTWLHNFTLYHEMKKIAHSAVPVYIIATIFAIISILAWLFGSTLLIKSRKIIGFVVLLIPAFAWFTDFLTFGDSRHRLVVVPLLLIGQVCAFRWMYERVFKGEGAWKP